MTNKEWLMTLPSIEMARIMYDFGDCSNCPLALSCSDQDTTCNEKMAEWLDKEYKGKDKEQVKEINKSITVSEDKLDKLIDDAYLCPKDYEVRKCCNRQCFDCVKEWVMELDSPKEDKC